MRLATFRSPSSSPFPSEFLDWQVALRRHTAEERGGAPHVGVAPLMTVRRPATLMGVVTHSIICGILPAPERLEQKTAEFRELYETTAKEGARVTYDAGLDYLRRYYTDPREFDPCSLSTLMSKESPAVQSLLADPRCSLLFYVFNLQAQGGVDRFRCLQLDCEAEVLEKGAVFENVWWHNTLFHGKAAGSVAIHFHHRKTFDTRFGDLQTVAG